MACYAVRRLMTEKRNLKLSPIENMAACPKSDDNIFEWEVVMIGPEGSPYEHGFFIADLVFSINYPMEPPKMKFISRIIHPNVYTDGRVCISILHSAGDDPYGYEDKTERWSPAMSIEKILICVLNMLCEPNFESPANIDAAKLYRENVEEYHRRIGNCVADTFKYEMC